MSSAISAICRPTTQTPLHKQLPSRYLIHTKPVIAILVPKLVAMATTLRHSSRLCLHRIAWPRKLTPRIKQCVTSYHTTKVIAHQMSKKTSYSNGVPKTGCHGKVPHHMIPWAHPNTQAKQHLDWFSCFCTDDRRMSLYFTSDTLSPESSTQTASRLVQLFLQGSVVWQTDRLTDHATPSVTTDRIYVRSTGDAV